MYQFQAGCHCLSVKINLSWVQTQLKSLFYILLLEFSRLMPKNIIKILEKNFSDMKTGEKMLISSPEKISEYVKTYAPGWF